mmetsp:Transcript_6704/g.19625  ORF Transcript_6704/g.19625 Transcript_6704/m.19625 type:complete len:271 (-) Transcript_6704:26-838(-)
MLLARAKEEEWWPPPPLGSGPSEPPKANVPLLEFLVFFLREVLDVEALLVRQSGPPNVQPALKRLLAGGNPPALGGDPPPRRRPHLPPPPVPAHDSSSLPTSVLQGTCRLHRPRPVLVRNEPRRPFAQPLRLRSLWQQLHVLRKGQVLATLRWLGQVLLLVCSFLPHVQELVLLLEQNVGVHLTRFHLVHLRRSHRPTEATPCPADHASLPSIARTPSQRASCSALQQHILLGRLTPEFVASLVMRQRPFLSSNSPLTLPFPRCVCDSEK